MPYNHDGDIIFISIDNKGKFSHIGGICKAGEVKERGLIGPLKEVLDETRS